MIHSTGAEQHAAWSARVLPPTERIAPLVWSVPVECPPFPVRYTLAYLLANEAGQFVVIDPGWDSGAGRMQLLEGIRMAGLSLDRLVGVVATHFHPDHLAMAAAIAGAGQAWTGIHVAEAGYIDRRPDAARSTRVHRAWLEKCGVPQAVRETIGVSEEEVEQLEVRVNSPRLLEDGDRLDLDGRNITVLWTPGHTAGHLVVIDHDSELIFTGDHVLPRISPNVALGAHDGGRNPLDEYFTSLDRMREWDHFEACPAHEYRFRGLAARAGQLREHHEARSREVAGVLAEAPSSSVWEVARRLTWSRGWKALDGLNMRGALAETAAHLAYLGGRGANRMRNAGEGLDSDG